ncbi:MAG: hypothetical protein A4S14_14625 [Proteobacteria bacterium SG_bin9]|nr:MAG: hypothetical protein A4S14_14625 [Proteobacteria bacterium SG_bin9]
MIDKNTSNRLKVQSGSGSRASGTEASQKPSTACWLDACPLRETCVNSGIASPLLSANAVIEAYSIGDMMRVQAEELPSLARLLNQYLSLFEVTQDSMAGDLLFGAQPISEFIGVSRRDVYYWMEKSAIPIAQPTRGGYLGRKSVLMCWLLSLELKSLRSIEP